MSDDRRGFFKTLGAATAALAAAPAVLNQVTTASAAVQSRSPAAGHFLLELDQVAVGFLRSADGGTATADVIEEAVGPDFIIHKHLGAVRYEDITITCGTGMSQAFYQWIQDTLDRKFSRRNGAIVAADFNFKEISRLNFTEALLTEIGFPACDAASKDAAFMTVKWSPEFTQQVKPSGATVKGISTKAQKLWLPSNFRLTINGLETATQRVNKIEALVVKQKFTEEQIGDVRDFQKEPSHLEFPNLVITFPESHAQAFYDWHEDFVINGNNGPAQEKGGMLEYLAPDLKTVLFTLEFFNLGIFKLAPEKIEAGGENIRRLKAEMYCEEMNFSFGPVSA